MNFLNIINLASCNQKRLLAVGFFSVVLSLLCIFFSHSITFDNVDVSGHYILAEKIFRDFYVNYGYIDNLGEMAQYPPASHFLASLFNYFTISGLVSLNIVSIIFIFLAWIVISKILQESGMIAYFISAIIFISIIIIGLNFPLIGIEITNGNFLYGQFIGTAYFVLLIYILHNLNLILWQRLLISLLGFFIGLYFHGTAAVLFFSGSFFYFFLLEFILIKNNYLQSIKRFVPLFLYGISGVILFYLNPYTQIANALRYHNGAVGFEGITGAYNFSFTANLLLFLVFLTSLAVCIYFIKHKNKNSLNQNFILVGSFLFGFCVIALLQRILLELGEVSPYVVKKNFFFIVTFWIVLISLIIEQYFYVKYPAWKKLESSYVIKLATLPLISIIFISIYWSKTAVDLDYFLKSQNIAKDYHELSRNDKSYRNTIAQFKDLSMPQNWLITMSELEIPRFGFLSHAVVVDMNTLPTSAFVLTEKIPFANDNGLMNSKTHATYEANEYFRPMPLESGSTIYINNKFAYWPNILAKGFALPDSTGSWTINELAQINFNIKNYKKNDLNVTLTGWPWVSSKAEGIDMSIYINNKLLSSKFLTRGVIDWVFTIPSELIPTNGNIKLDFKFDKIITPKEDNQSEDNRKVGFHLDKLTITY